MNTIHHNLLTIKNIFDKQYNLQIADILPEKESLEYGAANFTLNNKKIVFRVAKITPTKAGLFVTIWKRNKEGITEPFNLKDDLNFIIISVREENRLGFFLFPKEVLVDKRIISHHKEGKRGIRVYPPWVTDLNKQAEKTQQWQTKYFFTIDLDKIENIDLLRNLFNG